MRLYNKFFHVIQVLISSLFLWACGTFIGNPDDDKPKQQAAESQELNLSIATTEVSGLTKFVAKISKIILYCADSKTVELPLEMEAVDLLAHTELPLEISKSLDQVLKSCSGIALQFDPSFSSYAVKSDGTTVSVDWDRRDPISISLETIAPESQSGLTILVEYDLRRSITIENTSVKVTPKLRGVESKAAAEISGEAPDGSVVCIYPESTASLDDSADCPLAYASTIAKNGRYKIRYAVEGAYKVRIFSTDSSPLDSSQAATSSNEKSAGEDSNSGKDKSDSGKDKSDSGKDKSDSGKDKSNNGKGKEKGKTKLH